MPLRIEPPLYRRRVDFYTKSRAFDTTRARTELGFAPRIDLEEGIHRTAEWYRDAEPAVNKSTDNTKGTKRTKITKVNAGASGPDSGIGSVNFVLFVSSVFFVFPRDARA